jgi:GAF domain-containing protein
VTSNSWRLASKLAQTARTLTGSQPSNVAEATISLARDLIDGCSQASITVTTRGKSTETLAATDDRVRQCDEMQYELGQGPCLDAVWSSLLVLSNDLPNDPRWPVWAPAAAEVGGARSMVAVRMFTNDRTLGALNLYAEREAAFDEPAQAEAMAVASQAAAAVAAARQVANLRIAMDHRGVIGQAMGILMERYELTSDAAFAVLSRVSQHENTKLYDLACQLVETRKTPGDAAGGALP